MQSIADMSGEKLHALPDVAFVRIKMEQTEQDIGFSLIRNKAYKNVTSFLAKENERDRSDIAQDTMTVVDWLEGSYPNFFFSVEVDAIEQFTQQCAAIRSDKDYQEFVNRYGIRRTSSDFWKTADWFQTSVSIDKPVGSGIFDLNRFRN